MLCSWTLFSIHPVYNGFHLLTPNFSDVTDLPASQGTPGLIPVLVKSCIEGNEPTPRFLPGESHGQRSLEGYVPWGRRKPDMTEQRTFLSLSLFNRKPPSPSLPNPLPLGNHKPVLHVCESVSVW